MEAGAWLLKKQAREACGLSVSSELDGATLASQRPAAVRSVRVAATACAGVRLAVLMVSLARISLPGAVALAAGLSCAPATTTTTL
jgi:hypothetical protein